MKVTMKQYLSERKEVQDNNNNWSEVGRSRILDWSLDRAA